MNVELKSILSNIVTDLKEQGHNPEDRPIVFRWKYPDGILTYTLVIEKLTEEEVAEDEEDRGMVH